MSSASKAKVRKLFSEGQTTIDKLRPHVTVSDQQIQRYLKEIREELENETGSSLSAFVSTKAEAVIKSQHESLEERLGEIQGKLQSLVAGGEVGSKEYIQLTTAERHTMAEVRKLSGADLMLDIRDKKAMESVKVETSPLSSTPRTVGYRPKAKTARINPPAEV